MQVGRKKPVNKAELIEALSKHFDGSKADAAKALNAVVQTITYQAAVGEKVSITGFGVFEKVSRGERMVRNPRTGERTLAGPTAVPRFRAGTELKAYVSGAKQVPGTLDPSSTAAAQPPAAKVARVKKAVSPAAAKKPDGKKSDGKRSGKKSDAKKADGKRSDAKKASAKKASAKN